MEEDIAFLKSLEIDHLFDYRESSELDKPERHEEFAKVVHRISASEYLGGFDKEEDPVVLDMKAMVEFYRQIPFGNQDIKIYLRFYYRKSSPLLCFIIAALEKIEQVLQRRLYKSA